MLGREPKQRPRVCCLIALAWAWTEAQLPAQMSGAYTLDPAGSGARNFKDLGSAVAQLSKLGISGPVTIEMAAEGPQRALPVGGHGPESNGHRPCVLGCGNAQALIPKGPCRSTC